MPARTAYIIKSSPDGRRHVCVDAENEKLIQQFLRADAARLKKFFYIVDLILRNERIPELYDKEEIDESSKGVTAMKLFKGGQNARIYCKEVRDGSNVRCCVAAELLPKKQSQKVTNEIKALIHKVAAYQYEIKERPKSENKEH